MFWQLLLLLVLLIPLLAIVLDSQVGKALAARLEQRRLGEGDDALLERIRYLEGEVERLSSQVERLDEESDFLHDLLAERSSTDDRTLEPGGQEDD